MSKRGFTLVELIVTVVILGILLIPMGIMSMEFMREIIYSRDAAIAESLAKTDLAKVSNLSYADVSLADGYDFTSVNYEGYPYDLRRTVDFVAGSANNLKKVQVRVYPSGNTSELFANLISYIASVSFGAGSAGGALRGAGQAFSLTVSGGSISGKNLQNITLGNSSASAITITGIAITFSGASGIKLNTITIDSLQRWSGNISSPSTIVLAAPFSLSAGVTYSNTGFFNFSKNLSAASVTFIMQDGSQTSVYSW